MSWRPRQLADPMVLEKKFAGLENETSENQPT